MATEKGVDTIMDEQAVLQGFLGTLEYRIARTREELEKAYALVYKEYMKRGYVQESDTGLRFSIYNALPQTATFIALQGTDILATASVIPDTPLGLPMDSVYHDELNLLRAQNRKLCEISMLASETDLFRDGVSVMLNSRKLFLIFSLFKLIFDYAREYLKLDCLCISINPKHNLTYEFLLFRELGGLKTYHNANGAPAIAKYLDLASAEHECMLKNKEGLRQMFFVKRTPEDRFANKYIFSMRDLKELFTERTSIFAAASTFQMNHIKSSYPSYDFTQIS